MLNLVTVSWSLIYYIYTYMISTKLLEILGYTEKAAADITLCFKVLDRFTGDESENGTFTLIYLFRVKGLTIYLGTSPPAVVGAIGRAVNIVAYRHMRAAEGILNIYDCVMGA